MSGDTDRKRRRVVGFQRWVLNPPAKLVVWSGLCPGHVIVETRGRRTGRTRRTVVGAHREDGTLWIVSEHGRHAGWVRNIEAEPEVRVRHRGRWRDGRATIVHDDDAGSRLSTWDRPGHARIVRKVGTDLTTVRIDLDE